MPVAAVKKQPTRVEWRPMKRRGFTLLETLVALTILGSALIGMVLLVARATTIERRLDLHRLAIRELEAQHESLRAGYPLPGFSGTYEPGTITDLSRLGEPKLTLEVAGAGQVGLYRLDLKLQYRIGGETFERRLETLTYRP